MAFECRYPNVMLATCPVPWNDAGECEEGLFRSTVRRLRRELTPCLYLFGTAGEGYAVNDQQFERVARAFRDEMSGEPRAMVGIISLSLATIIDRIALGRELGFREFQLSLPGWGALNDREVGVFFRETCGRFPDCSFLHYNLPRVKRVLRGVDYAPLVRAHPNLVAVKMGGADLAAQEEVAATVPELRCFFTEGSYAALRERFACGLLVALSSINPARSREFFAARGPTLEALGRELQEIRGAMKAAVAEGVHMDGAFDKLYIKLHEPNFPLRLLPPYESTSDATFEKFRVAIPAAWRV